MRGPWRWGVVFFAAANGCVLTETAAETAEQKPAVWARVQLLAPRDTPYKVQVVVR